MFKKLLRECIKMELRKKMKNVTINKDGSLTIEPEFFKVLLEMGETMVDVTVTIEYRNGQINLMNPKIKRSGH